MTTNFIQINKSKLYYIQEGEGFVTLILPGWDSIIDHHPYTILYSKDYLEISKGYKTIILHLSNFYKSSLNSEISNLDFYIEEIKNFLDEMGIKKLNLIGHSAGGRFAIHFSYKYPQYINKLVLLDSAGLKHRHASKQTLKNAFRFFAKNLLNYEEKILLSNIFKNVYESDLSEEIKQIAITTLILWGEQDKTIDVKNAYIFHSLIENSELKIYRDLDHMTLVHKEVLIYIFNFLKTANESKLK